MSAQLAHRWKMETARYVSFQGRARVEQVSSQRGCGWQRVGERWSTRALDTTRPGRVRADRQCGTRLLRSRWMPGHCRRDSARKTTPESRTRPNATRTHPKPGNNRRKNYTTSTSSSVRNDDHQGGHRQAAGNI